MTLRDSLSMEWRHAYESEVAKDTTIAIWVPGAPLSLEEPKRNKAHYVCIKEYVGQNNHSKEPEGKHVEIIFLYIVQLGNGDQSGEKQFCDCYKPTEQPS